MDTSNRKLKILAKVVEEYIRTGEPIGSKAIAQSFDTPISSATIRNDMAALEKIFSAHTFDAVIHFAAFKAVGESCKLPLKYYENNISGTVNLLKVMEKFGVKKIIFSSSASLCVSSSML